MDSQAIWEQLYTKSLENKAFLDHEEKEHLYYFIDLIYQIEMGGFLYNQSPTNEDENHYLPYINSLIFFQRREIANELADYNRLYQKALKQWKVDERVDFTKILRTNSVEVKGEKIDELLQGVQEKYDDVFEWINSNQDKLV